MSQSTSHTGKLGPTDPTRAFRARPHDERPIEPGAKSSVCTGIETALKNLERGESIFIDATGRIHRGKESFLDKSAEPLASFTKPRLGDDVVVHAGLPPRNPTFCRSERALPRPHLTDELAKPLRYSTVLRSGDRLSLGLTCELEIPRRSISKPTTASEKLSSLVAQAEPGAIIELGRFAVPECDRGVSRVHCTVEVLDKKYTGDGSFSMSVRVFPGIPGTHAIALEHPSGAREEIQGERSVAPGMKVFIGEKFGTLQLPYPTGSFEEMSFGISQSIIGGKADMARKALQSFDANPHGEYSEDVIGRQRVKHNNPEALLKSVVLQDFVCHGLQFIKDGKHAEAIAHFRNPILLEACGYRFEENNLFVLSAITPEAILNNMRGVGARSWFKVKEKLVYPSLGVLKDGVIPQNDDERDLLSRWRKDIALVYAEEYTHALQDLLGGKMVSRKAALLPVHDHESDVALFFDEQGVRLSTDFIKNRYPERETALRLAGGFQTEETQGLFQQALASLPIGGALYVGRDATRLASESLGIAGFSLPMPPEKEADAKLHGLRPRMAHSLLAAVEASISRNPEGNYTVTPVASAASAVFLPDSAGFYERARQAKIVEPGTPIYIGRAFRLVL